MEAIRNKLRAVGRNISITPECDNMSGSLHISALISLSISVLMFVACLGYYVYHYFFLKDDADGNAKREKLVKYSIWASTAYIAINTLNSIWLYMTASGLADCIKPSA